MTRDAVVTGPRLVRVPAPGPRRPSTTRAASSRRTRLVQEARRGNTNAMRSGIHADVANIQHVSDEVALIYAARPYLDAIADHRLVELLAVATVQHRRAVLAIDAQGPDANLTKWEANLGARVERHEQRVHERNEERRKAAQATAAVDLTQYRQPRAAS